MDVARIAPWKRRKKTRAAAPAAATATATATLPEDVVIEILERVADAAALFRCAVACKPWLGLVADRAFLRRRWPGQPSLIGFFAQQGRHTSRVVSADPLAGTRSPAFVPAPRSPLGSNRRSLGSFVSGATGLFDLDGAGMLDDAVPLTARQGLLLVRLAPRGGAPAVGTSQAIVHLAVCDLHAGTCDALPPLECTASSSINNCAILTDADRSPHKRRRSPSPLPGRSSLFKVLVIVFDPDTSYYYLRTFSSTKSTWSEPRPCFSKTALRIADGSAAVCRDTAHWFACDGWETCRTLNVSTGTGRPSSTHVYIPQSRYDFGLYVTPWLGAAMDGTLPLFHLHGGCRLLHVWTRHGRHNVNWSHSKEIELRPPEQKAICEDVQCLCADQGSGMLLVMDRLERVYIVDLQTGGVDEVTEQFQRLELQTVVPFEMDWQTFFFSRLEGHKEEENKKKKGGSNAEPKTEMMRRRSRRRLL
ncbi:hypothetical protein ACQJBY_003651 [Aegilops geniculata]